MSLPLRVHVHVAQTLDGRLGVEGTRTTLSTAEGQRAAHEARARADAVLVGINTVRIDDPKLTVRDAIGSDPLRVVLASQLDVPLHAHVLDRSRGKVLVLGAQGRATEAAERDLKAAGAEVEIASATVDGRVSLEDTIDRLAKRGVTKLLVEGGSRVLTSFFRAKLVHRVTMEINASFLGASGTPMLGELGMMDGGGVKLVNVEVDRLGSNILVRGDVEFRLAEEQRES